MSYPSTTLETRLHVERHDDELGCWTQAVCLPHPVLEPHIEVIFHGHGAVSYSRDRLLPRGQPHLLINLGPPQYLVHSNGGRTAFHDIWFSGQQETFLETEAPHGTELIGVAFRSSGAYQALGVDQHDLAGRVLSLSDVLGDPVMALKERLVNTADVNERFRVVENWLLGRLGQGREIHPATRWAVECIHASSGRVSVGKLAEDSGYSRKHLIRLFRRQVGLTPKRLAQLHRFHAALALARREPGLGWSHVAADCGYYDQSHLIRDVKRFTGLTPEALLATPAADETTLALG